LNVQIKRTVNNKIGAKRTLLFGTLGYALYVGSYLQVLFLFLPITILMPIPAQSISTLALAGLLLPRAPFSVSLLRSCGPLKAQ
jgi:hypothetical protein